MIRIHIESDGEYEAEDIECTDFALVAFNPDGKSLKIPYHINGVGEAMYMMAAMNWSLSKRLDDRGLFELEGDAS